ncbi:head GIN domain-containing protein [Pareuzebyella sediminis]|uniref:head GIN domain-containing protein n=1 Tax=Pareuzebyella sediminis TaxID=2607998 RepID=UPI0011EDB9AF|nr:head GIN domain-containing protein [Pareuzebyella sediminis]
MKKTVLFSTLVVLCSLMISCDIDHIRAKGEVTSRDLTLTGYTGLNISNAFEVFVTFSDTVEDVRIEANDNLHDRVVVAREGNDLVIRLKKHTLIRGNPTLNVYITTREIKNIDLNGASKVFFENTWETESGNVKLSGASELMGEVDIDHLELDLRGASKADIYGKATSLHADLRGASDLRDYDLLSNRLHIKLSGASEAFLSAIESIAIDAAGSSVLNYKGDAIIVHKDLRGASQLKHRN